jgi:alanine dehydrogenase
MSEGKSGFEELAKGASASLFPQESLLKVKDKKYKLFIGIPKEIALQENRVPLSPSAVALLVNNGHEIWLETGAGIASNFSDHEYSEVGARIVYSHRELFQSDIVLKVEPPTMEELGFLKPGRTLISAIQIGNQTADFIQALNQKKITSIGFELIEDKVGGMPVVRAMSEIAGSAVMFIAAEYLSSVHNGKGIVLGGVTGVPHTKVLIIGAGTVAEYAARTALGLGVDIQIFDNQIYKLRRIKHALGQQVYTSTFDPITLSKNLNRADVVIGAKRWEKGRGRFVVTEEMVSQMKPGSVIIDVSIDQGGCIETSELTTHDKPVFRKYGIIHYCVPNIASRVARTASMAFSNILAPILLETGDAGGIQEMIFNCKWFMKGVYTYKGSLTNADIANKFNMKHKDLNLLMAARI